jgi:hypothetical protein
MRVLSDAARRTSITVGKFAYHSKEDRQRLAALMRSLAEDSRDVDTQSSILLRSYRLQNRRRRPIGVFVGNANDAARFKGARRTDEEGKRPQPKPPKPSFLGTRAADLSYLGYFRLHVPEGVDPFEDVYQRWLKGEPHYKPQAEWISSSPFGSDALQGRPPVLINLHHGKNGFVTQIMNEPRRPVIGRTLPDAEYRKEFVAAGDLVELLLRDRHLKSALFANPKSDIFLGACSVSKGEAQVIADALGRTTHFSTGHTMIFDPTQLFRPVSDNPRLPFSVTGEPLLGLISSLEGAPPQLTNVGRVHGWSALATFGDIQTVTAK